MAVHLLVKNNESALMASRDMTDGTTCKLQRCLSSQLAGEFAHILETRNVLVALTQSQIMNPTSTNTGDLGRDVPTLRIERPREEKRISKALIPLTALRH